MISPIARYGTAISAVLMLVACGTAGTASAPVSPSSAPPSTSTAAVGSWASGTVLVANGGNGGRNLVTVIEPGRNEPSRTITVGRSPEAIVVAPPTATNAGTAFVANADDGSVSLVKPGATHPYSTIRVGDSPMAEAVSSIGTVYVANYDGTLSVIEAGATTVSSTIRVGAHPDAVAVDGAGTVYVANRDDNTLTVIRSESVSTVALPGSPFALAIAPAGTPEGSPRYAGAGALYVATYDDMVYRVADGNVSGGIRVGTEPIGGLAIAPAGSVLAGTVYVANYGDGTMSVIPPGGDSVLRTVPIGGQPNGIDVDEAGNVYVGNLDSTSVSEVRVGETNVTRSIEVGPRAGFVAVVR